MTRVLFYVLFIYVILTQYMIRGYERMNDQLQRANGQLLYSCTLTPMSKDETKAYK